MSALDVPLRARSAELNRTPADISEAESEIVAGYHTEYSGMRFGLFYAVELANTLAISAFFATFFLGGWWLWGLDQWVPSWLILLAKTGADVLRLHLDCAAPCRGCASTS